MANINSQWYPYVKVYEGFYDLSQTVDIPRKIMDYLLDMPNGEYSPKDDNSYPRARLWKNLYYDGARPLENPLPTPKQKMSVLFDPEDPTRTKDEEKGWRLIPQIYIKPSQTTAQTRINVYMGRTIADSDFKVQLSVVFDVWTHYTQEANSKTLAYSRLIDITQSIIQAFHGVNMAGVGTFYYNRSKHPDCGENIMSDKDSNIGRSLILGLEIASETLNGHEEYNGVPFGNGELW